MRAGGVWGSRHGILALVCFSLRPGSSLRLPPDGRIGSKHVRAAAGQCRSPLDPWTYEPEGGHTPPRRLGTRQDRDCLYLYGNESAGGAPEWTKWRFAPPGASDWRDFNPQTFCEALVDCAQVPGQARMLFVGDSMSRDHMYSLMLELGGYAWSADLQGRNIGAKTWSEDDQAYVFGGKNDGALACGGRAWMQQFGSRDLLRSFTGGFGFEDHLPWVHSFDVIVLQVPWQVGPVEGTHFWKSAALPRQRVLFRTPTVGHEGAGVAFNATRDEHINPMLKSRPHSAPLRSPEEVIAYYAQQEGHASWLGKRERMEDLMLEVEREGAAVADFFYLSAMMWHQHHDPLHYCVPGPQEKWNDVLFNWLVRGHLRDYQDWSWKFSRAVSALGGVHNKNGIAYPKQLATEFLAPQCLDAEAAA